VLSVLALTLRTVRVTERIRIVSLSQMSFQNFTPRNFRLGSRATMPSKSPLRRVHPRKRPRWTGAGAAESGH
jgi:hypothetical protein